MTHGGELLAATGPLLVIPRSLGALGHHGVTLFFILSGFVIPYALIRAGTDARFGPFLVKRLIRLQPPFLTACALTIALNQLSMQAPGYAGQLGASYLSKSFLQMMTDNIYITGMLGRSWILVVAWTLAIEVQFYLVAGISKKWLIARPLLLMGSVALLSLALPQPALVFHWLPIFALGALVAVRFPSWHWRDVALAGLLIVLVGFTFSPTEAVVATASLALIVLAIQDRLPRVPLLAWLGSISYSLYLIHVPIGGRIVNLAARIAPTPPQQLLICITATMASIAAAWVFWRLIEFPSHQWSRKL
jgi:peptidoglycan/LPS O-acetylase OafA/YrhL